MINFVIIAFLSVSLVVVCPFGYCLSLWLFIYLN
jgi:hypothetical protein